MFESAVGLTYFFALGATVFTLLLICAFGWVFMSATREIRAARRLARRQGLNRKEAREYLEALPRWGMKFDRKPLFVTQGSKFALGGGAPDFFGGLRPGAKSALLALAAQSATRANLEPTITHGIRDDVIAWDFAKLDPPALLHLHREAGKIVDADRKDRLHIARLNKKSRDAELLAKAGESLRNAGQA